MAKMRVMLPRERLIQQSKCKLKEKKKPPFWNAL